MRKKGRIITDFQGTTYSAELPKGNYHHTEGGEGGEGGGWWQMRPPGPSGSEEGGERAVKDVLRGSVG